MSDSIVTRGIVLSRREFGEADRILTVLTADQGKLGVIAKGVRRPKSKLAGGIELFSVSDLTILRGKGELRTLISSRLITHYGQIVKDVRRTMLGYDVLKQLDRTLEDNAEDDYFELLVRTLEGLDNSTISIELCELWFTLQLLKLGGHTPNLQTDVDGHPLDQLHRYEFDFDNMCFRMAPAGAYGANHIKLLRLAIGTSELAALGQLQDAAGYVGEVLALAKNMTRQQA